MSPTAPQKTSPNTPAVDVSPSAAITISYPNTIMKTTLCLQMALLGTCFTPIIKYPHQTQHITTQELRRFIDFANTCRTNLQRSFPKIPLTTSH